MLCVLKDKVCEVEDIYRNGKTWQTLFFVFVDRKRIEMNKNNFILTALLLCGACAGRADEYVVRGGMPGLKDGMTVKLRNVEKEKAVLLASDTVRNGRFELRGNIATPTLCELVVTNRSLVTEKNRVKTGKTWVFLDNSELILAAPHFDSIGYVSTSMFFAEERNDVRGSLLQDEFNAYRRALLPLELNTQKYESELSEICFESYKYRSDEYAAHYARLWPQICRGRARVREARMDFIRRHPQSPVSLYVAERILKEAGSFVLTSEFLDSLAVSLRGVTGDSVRMARFGRSMTRARQLARGLPFGDFSLENLSGDSVRLSASIPDGRYTLIDFWASWCGPCRAALPQVKELCRRYDGRLAVVSVSCDKKADAWKKAVREEKLGEWPQLRAATGQSGNDVYKYYNVTSIPNLVLIDPEGRVVLSTDDPQILAQVLEESI